MSVVQSIVLEKRENDTNLALYFRSQRNNRGIQRRPESLVIFRFRLILNIFIVEIVKIKRMMSEYFPRILYRIEM